MEKIIIYNNACGNEETDILMPIINTNAMSVNMGDFTPNISCSEMIGFSRVKCIKLDNINFLCQINFIKIDVQGWEKNVLLGAENLIKTNKPILIVEFEWFQLAKTNTSCEELFALIRHMDYTIFYLEYTYPSDHVCVHNSYVCEFKQQFSQYIFPHNETNQLNNNFNNGVTEKIVINI